MMMPCAARDFLISSAFAKSFRFLAALRSATARWIVLAMLQTLMTHWPQILAIIPVVMAAIGIVHAIMTKEDVRAATGWVGVMFLSPFLGAIIYAVPGLLVGAVAGLVIQSEKWVPVSVASVTQFRVVPHTGGVVAQMSFSFH